MPESEQVLKRIRYVAEAYFHQDWLSDAQTPDRALLNLRSDEAPVVVAQVIADVTTAFTLLTDEQLGHLWIEELGAYYDPVADGLSYREWFELMLEILSTR